MNQSQSILYENLDRILINAADVQAAVKELGQRISQDYRGKEPVFIYILKGAVMFFTDLIRAVDLPLTIDFMAISSWRQHQDIRRCAHPQDLDHDIVGGTWWWWRTSRAALRCPISSAPCHSAAQLPFHCHPAGQAGAARKRCMWTTAALQYPTSLW